MSAEFTRSYRITAETFHSAEFLAACVEHGVTVSSSEVYYPGIIEFEAVAQAKISQDEFGIYIDGTEDW